MSGEMRFFKRIPSERNIETGDVSPAYIMLRINSRIEEEMIDDLPRWLDVIFAMIRKEAKEISER